MNFDLLSDEDIARLIALPKRVSNPSVRWQDKPGHRQRNFKAEGGDHSFELYLRQSTHNSEDFSCGLKVIKPDGQPLTLLRYNGGGHNHGEIVFSCHIHRAHNRPLKREKRPNPMPNQPKITGHLMVHWLVCLKMQLYPGCYTWRTMRPIYLIEVCHAGNAG